MATRLPLTYGLTNLLLVLLSASLIVGGVWIVLALVAIAVLGSVVDEALGDDRRRLGAAARVFLTANLYATLPLVTVMTFLFLNRFADHAPGTLLAALDGAGPAWLPMPGNGDVAAVFAVGMFYAVASITVGHELIHWTRDGVAVRIGRALLAFTLNTPYAISHLRGHHRTVGTLADPATAKRNEYVLGFAVRCAFAQAVEAVQFEADRLRRRGHNPYGWRNRGITGYWMSLIIMIAAFVFAGVVGLVAFVIAALMGLTLFQMVSYYQHYGLVRVPGTGIQPRHSWDCYRRVSSVLLYNAPRHAEHHLFADRRAWDLGPPDGEAPMLPYGYKTLMLVALIPGWWRSAIHPRLADWDHRLASDAERQIIHEQGWEIAGYDADAMTARVA